MSYRLTNALVGVGFGLIALAIFFVVALLVKVLFKKQIWAPKYYTSAMVVGFLIPHVLLAVFPSASSSSVEARPVTVMTATGLDAPFIPPAEADLEKFPEQLAQALERLSPQDKSEVSEAIGFLAYILAANMRETAPKDLEHLSDSDLTAKWLNKLYRYAQTNGKNMTLRRYIDLADVARNDKPHWWSEYKATSTTTTGAVKD